MTGDDFGLNSRVNEAVERYHQAGLLTQASLMVNEPGVDEALRVARRNPRMLVGLHLVLCAGRAALRSPLTDAALRLADSPARAGLRYAFSPWLSGPLVAEIAAQFEKFRALGLEPVYWDGHTHLHLHPTVLKLTLPVAAANGFRVTRLVREPGGGMLPWVFRTLSRAAAVKLTRHGIRAVDGVYGLRDTGAMTTARAGQILRTLPEGWSELYFHPGAEPEELDASRLVELAMGQGIEFGTARELAGFRPPPYPARAPKPFASRRCAPR